MANEKRLIDANALKKKARLNGHCIRPMVTGYHQCVNVSDIDSAPTVDAVEVVRCKDCKHWVAYFDCCEKKDITMHEDDFCSFGERREGE